LGIQFLAAVAGGCFGQFLDSFEGMGTLLDCLNDAALTHVVAVANYSVGHLFILPIEIISFVKSKEYAGSLR
jgi:hypothetical protein